MFMISFQNVVIVFCPCPVPTFSVTRVTPNIWSSELSTIGDSISKFRFINSDSCTQYCSSPPPALQMLLHCASLHDRSICILLDNNRLNLEYSLSLALFSLHLARFSVIHPLYSLCGNLKMGEVNTLCTTQFSLSS